VIFAFGKQPRQTLHWVFTIYVTTVLAEGLEGLAPLISSLVIGYLPEWFSSASYPDFLTFQKPVLTICRGLHLVTAYLLQFRPVHRQFPNVWISHPVLGTV